MQRLPLQRVGVLELIDQQVANARIQPLLHPARKDRVGQHDQGRALHIVHVHPAVLLLDGGKLRNQAARQPGHALLVLPGLVLAAGHQQALQLGLGLLRGGNFSRFFDRRSSLATNIALRSMSRRWFRSGQASASMMASAAFAGLVGLRHPKRWHGCASAAGRLLGLQGLGGSANAASSGYACWNGGTEASTTPATSAKSNSTAWPAPLPAPCAFAIGHGGPPRLRGRRAGWRCRPRSAKRGHTSRTASASSSSNSKWRAALVAAAAAPAGRAQQRGKPAVEGADLHRAAPQQLAV